MVLGNLRLRALAGPEPAVIEMPKSTRNWTIQISNLKAPTRTDAEGEMWRLRGHPRFFVLSTGDGARARREAEIYDRNEAIQAERGKEGARAGEGGREGWLILMY